jgi:hypothetical protein
VYTLQHLPPVRLVDIIIDKFPAATVQLCAERFGILHAPSQVATGTEYHHDIQGRRLDGSNLWFAV